MDRKGEKLELYIELSKLKAMLPQGADYLSDKEYYVEKKVEAGKTTLSAEPVEECYINFEEIKLPMKLMLQKLILVNIGKEWSLSIYTKILYTGDKNIVARLMSDGIAVELKWGEDSLKAISDQSYVFDAENLDIGVAISGKVEVTYSEYDIKNNKFKMFFSSMASNDISKYIVRLKEKIDWQLAYDKSWKIKPMCWPFEKPLEIGGLGDWITFPDIPIFDALALELPEVDLDMPNFEFMGGFKLALESINIPFDFGKLALNGLSIPFGSILKYIGIGNILGNLDLGNLLSATLIYKLIEGEYKVRFEENDAIIVSSSFDKEGHGLMLEASAASTTFRSEIKEANFIYTKELIFVELSGNINLFVGEGSSLETSLKIEFEKTAVEVKSGVPVYSHYLNTKFKSAYGLSLDFAARAHWSEEIWNSPILRELGEFINNSEYRFTEDSFNGIGCEASIEYLAMGLSFMDKNIVFIDADRRFAIASSRNMRPKNQMAAVLNFYKFRDIKELFRAIDLGRRTAEESAVLAFVRGDVACGLGTPAELGIGTGNELAVGVAAKMTSKIINASASMVLSLKKNLTLDLEGVFSATLKYFMNMDYFISIKNNKVEGKLVFHQNSFIYAEGLLSNSDLKNGIFKFSCLNVSYLELKNIKFLPSITLFRKMKIGGCLSDNGDLYLLGKSMNFNLGGLVFSEASVGIIFNSQEKGTYLSSLWFGKRLYFNFYLNGRDELCAESKADFSMGVSYTVPVYEFFNGVKAGGNIIYFTIDTTAYINIKNSEVGFKCMAEFTFMGSMYCIDLNLSPSDIPSDFDGFVSVVTKKVADWIDIKFMPDLGNPSDVDKFFNLLYSGTLGLGQELLKEIAKIMVKDFKMSLPNMTNSLKNGLKLGEQEIKEKVVAAGKAIGAGEEAVKGALEGAGIPYNPFDDGGGGVGGILDPIIGLF